MLLNFRYLYNNVVVGLTAACLCGQLLVQTPAIGAAERAGAYQKMVVIDAGHGGHQDGVTGPGGTLEKSIALEFSQHLYQHLEDRYRVHLTRTADYSLDHYQRADMANHLQAHLFISIHAGSSYRRQSSGIEIYYFQSQPTPALAPPAGPNEMVATAWDSLQDKHRLESRRLGQMLKSRIEAGLPDQNCRIHAAPLLVLSGLDMPAILIEIGYLSNPAEEKMLQDPRHLDDLAEFVSRSIDAFFD